MRVFVFVVRDEHARGDLEATMPVLSVTLPILPDKLETWRRCRQELHGSRHAEYEQSCQRLGILSISSQLIETQLGTAILYTIEAQHVGQAISELAISTMPFDCWLKDQLLNLHGVQFTTSGT